MIKFLILAIFVIVFKSATNFAKWYRCKKLSKEHALWFKQNDEKFLYHKGEARRLLKGANIPDISIPISEPTGYGPIRNYTAPIFENLDSKNVYIASTVVGKFDEAIGTYFHRAIESFNPLYWLETIIFLPKSLLQYVGMDMNKPAFKLCNVLLTFIWWLISSLFIFFNEEFNRFIASFFT